MKYLTSQWINTKVVIDIRSGKVIEEQGYWYNGPLALATDPPTRTAGDWAFYSDGTEAEAVIFGEKNVNQTLEVDTIYHFRIGFWNNDADAWKNATVQLEYNYESGGWNDVNATSSVVRSAPTSGLVDGENSTQRITAFAFDATNEGQDEVDGEAGGGDADFTNNGAEAVFAFTIRSEDVADEDTIVLKITDAAENEDLDVYEQTDPTITVNEEVGVTIITPGVGSLSLSGQDLKASATIALALDALSITGKVLTPSMSVTQVIGVGSLAASGLGMQLDRTRIQGVGALTLTGKELIIPSDTILQIAKGSLTLTGQSLIRYINVTKILAKDSLAIVGKPLTAAMSVTIVIAKGTLTLATKAFEVVSGVVVKGLQRLGLSTRLE